MRTQFVRKVLLHPNIWWSALRVAWQSRPRAGLVDDAYIGWRTATAYGSAEIEASDRDLVDFVAWAGRQRRLRR